MRLPGDAAFADAAEAEDGKNVRNQEHRGDEQDALVGERLRERHQRRGTRVLPQCGKTAAINGGEQKAHRRAHQAGDRARRTDHRHHGAGIEGEEGCSSRDGAEGKEQQEAQRADTVGHRAAEGHEPGGVQPQVHPVAVHHRVGEERRHRRDIAARQHPGIAGVARRDEGERQRQPGVPIRGQPHADEVDGHHHPQHRKHAHLHVEHRLVSAHADLSSGSGCWPGES